MIDFNYTAPELLPLRIQEVLDAPNEPHRIGGVVYVPEGVRECELEIKDNMNESEDTGAVWWECSSCHWQIEFFHTRWLKHAKFCPNCGERIGKRRKLRDGELTELLKMQVERFNARAERLREEGEGE